MSNSSLGTVGNEEVKKLDVERSPLEIVKEVYGSYLLKGHTRLCTSNKGPPPPPQSGWYQGFWVSGRVEGVSNYAIRHCKNARPKATA